MRTLSAPTAVVPAVGPLQPEVASILRELRPQRQERVLRTPARGWVCMAMPSQVQQAAPILGGVKRAKRCPVRRVASGRHPQLRQAGPTHRQSEVLASELSKQRPQPPLLLHHGQCGKGPVLPHPNAQTLQCPHSPQHHHHHLGRQHPQQQQRRRLPPLQHLRQWQKQQPSGGVVRVLHGRRMSSHALQRSHHHRLRPHLSQVVMPACEMPALRGAAPEIRHLMSPKALVQQAVLCCKGI
mmetsp:Transcript_32324/g.81666  ORF Transcript_32324/g.81666 Transcript_32324/m.81666 type:complete len:240 (+) Transcript_32324:59-778(+)